MESVGKALMKQYALVVNKAWGDEEFRAALLANPRKVLSEEGVAFPEALVITIADGEDVQSFDSSKNLLVLPLPVRPDGISEDEPVITAESCCCCCCPCCCC
ncbi:MAG: hypothetical protein FWH20_05420 [Oscillospiraceae bacterium]|nr:hypothetical protein [Oscillospiraceae bacterium]